MQDQSRPKQKKRNPLSNWIGILIFLALIFGSQISRVLSNVLGQVFGVVVPANTLLFVLIGGLIAFSVLTSIINTAVNAGKPKETSLPTSAAPPAPPRPNPPPASSASSVSSPPRPVRPPSLQPPPNATQWSSRATSDITTSSSPQIKPPGFEPIISPKVLAFGILGLLLLGGVFAAAFVLSAGLP